jgi:hypothetical protein
MADTLDRTKLSDQLKQCMRYTSDIISNRTQHGTHVDRMKTDIIRQIQQVRKDVDEIFDKLEKSTIDQLSQIDKQETDVVNDQISKCESVRRACSKAQATLESSQKTTPGDVPLDLQEIRLTCTRSERLVRQEQERVRDIVYTFNTNAFLDEFLSALTGLGTITVQRAHADLSPLPKNFGTDVKTEVGKQTTRGGADVAAMQWDPPLSNRRAKQTLKFSAKTENDKTTCALFALEYLAGGRMLIADKENESLKLFSESGNVADVLKLAHAPRRLTMLEPAIAAITMEDANQIQLVTVGQRLALTKCILTQFCPWGIAGLGRQQLAVSCLDDCSVKFLSLDGEVLRSVDRDKDGARLFECPLYVHANLSGSEVYVSDRDSDVISAIAPDGTCRFRYTHPRLKVAHGMAVDAEDNVYACAAGSHNVHQLTSDGVHVKIMLSDVSYARAMSFKPNSNKFMLTTCSGIASESNIVKIYTLT